MHSKFAEISVKGKTIRIPALTVDQRTVVVTGKALKVAQLHDEEWMEGDAIENLDLFLSSLRAESKRIDLFTFRESVTNPLPRFPHFIEWEDVAAVPITTYSEWWDGLPQESRKNVRRAEKRGLVVRLASFDDALIHGIKSIYDETPIRQGRSFWHYGKDLESVRRENATYLDRSDFVAAYFGDELIGFIKIVYVGKVGRIMQIISKNAHADKRPPNALLAKAVEACCNRGMTHFVYGQYFYGTKGHTPITEFKHRNGFKRIMIPRYFVPLTIRGRGAMTLRLHRGVKSLIPALVMNFLLEARGRMLNRHAKSPPQAREPERHG